MREQLRYRDTRAGALEGGFRARQPTADDPDARHEGFDFFRAAFFEDLFFEALPEARFVDAFPPPRRRSGPRAARSARRRTAVSCVTSSSGTSFGIEALVSPSVT